MKRIEIIITECICVRAFIIFSLPVEYHKDLGSLGSSLIIFSSFLFCRSLVKMTY